MSEKAERIAAGAERLASAWLEARDGETPAGRLIRLTIDEADARLRAQLETDQAARVAALEACLTRRYAQAAVRRDLLAVIGAAPPKPRRRRWRVFLSYRREASGDLTRHLAERLAKVREIGVFFDRNSLSAGPFPEAIERAVTACDVFVLLVGGTTFERAEDPGDWVRREIELALKLDKKIIPVVQGGVRFEPAVLPDALKPLADHNALFLHADDFDSGVRRLAAWIKG